MACSFANVFPIRFKHAALALRSKYKRGEAGLHHIPQDGGTDQIHLSRIHLRDKTAHANLPHYELHRAGHEGVDDPLASPA